METTSHAPNIFAKEMWLRKCAYICAFKYPCIYSYDRYTVTLFGMRVWLRGDVHAGHAQYSQCLIHCTMYSSASIGACLLRRSQITISIVSVRNLSEVDCLL